MATLGGERTHQRSGKRVMYCVEYLLTGTKGTWWGTYCMQGHDWRSLKGGEVENVTPSTAGLEIWTQVAAEIDGINGNHGVAVPSPGKS